MPEGNLYRCLFFFSFWILFGSSRLLSQDIDTQKIDELILEAYHLELSNPKSALVIAKEVYQTSKANNYAKGRASGAMRLGSIFNFLGKNDSALVYMKEARDLRVEINDIDGATNACFQLDYIYREKGQLDSSFFVLFQAIRLNSLDDHLVNKGTVYVSLANLSLDYQEPDTALYFIGKAIAISEKAESFSLKVNAISTLGRYFVELSQWKKAIQQFKRVDSLSTFLNNPLLKAENYNNTAVCYEKINQVDQAVKQYHLALSEYQQAERKFEKATILTNLGILYYNANQLDSSEYYILRALEVSREMDALVPMAENTKHLSDLYERKSEYGKALGYYKDYKALEDSILSVEKVRSISEMQTKYDSEVKEQRILLLNEKNKLRTAERNTLLVVILIFVLVSVSVAIYLIQRRTLAQKNAEIADQKLNTLLVEQEIKMMNATVLGQDEERQRIASDLHDRLGSMLSTVKILYSNLRGSSSVPSEENLEKLIDEACVEVRRISHNLSTGMVQSFGLKAALNDLAEGVSTIIKTEVLYYGLEKRLPLSVEMEVFKIIQEVVNNALKHSKAKKITIQLNKIDDQLTVTVEDNGKGFNPEQLRKGGIGLTNLKTRAQKIHGSFHLDSSPGRGTLAILEVPLKPIQDD